MKMDRRVMLSASLAMAILPQYKAQARVVSRPEDTCPAELTSKGDTAQICNAVSDQLIEAPDAVFGNRFVYQTQIYSISHADPLRDPPQHVAKKIQHWWISNLGNLNCNQLGFELRDGSLLKLAIAQDANHFINDVVRRWGLWLNGLDVTGQTALDFIQAELDKNYSNNGNMVQYQLLFARFGAKRAADLAIADRPLDPFEVEIRPLLQTWERACYFNEGLAAVKRGGLWGYVDAGGQVIVPPRYDGAFAFSQGRAAVQRGGLWGYIDLTGREVIPLKYADARVFGADGLASVTLDGHTWTKITGDAR